MITQEQFDNLQVGDKLTNGVDIGEIQAIHHKVILVLWDDDEVYHYPFGEAEDFKLLKPIQYNQGFEVREYPERPVVLVGESQDDICYLRFLAEVKKDKILAVTDGNSKDSSCPSCKWKFIKQLINE